MKVGLVCPYDIQRAGGVQQVVLDSYGYLPTLGIEAKILAPLSDKGVSDNPDIIQLGISSSVSMYSTQFEVTMAPNEEIEAVLKREKFDLIHIHEPWVPFLPLQVSNEATVPLVCTCHGTPVDTWKANLTRLVLTPYLKGFIEQFDAVMTVSSSPVAYLRDFYKGNIEIIPNGINTKQLPAEAQPFSEYRDGYFNILFLGRMDTRKGVIYLLRAYEQIKRQHPKTRLLIAGTGQELPALKKYTQEHALKDVHFLGYVSEEDKWRWYATCDVYCSPALGGESFGIVFLEAMISGKPVIGTAIPGYKDVLKGKGKQMLVKPGDAKDIVKKLSLLIENVSLQEELRQWGKEEVKQYDLPLVMKQIVSVYERVLHNQS